MSHHILLKNARKQSQKIKLQDPIHPKSEKSNLKQLSKQQQTLHEQCSIQTQAQLV